METHFAQVEDPSSRAARERVLADLKALAGDAEALLRATADDASDKAMEARARLNAAVEKAKLTCTDLHERGAAAVKDAAKKADDTIRTHPYESIAIAFGVGLLAGVLLKRNTRNE